MPCRLLILQWLAGYVVDRLVGNTRGLGGILGIFYALGVPVPWVFYNTLGWKVGVAIGYVQRALSCKLLALPIMINPVTLPLYHGGASAATNACACCVPLDACYEQQSSHAHSRGI